MSDWIRVQDRLPDLHDKVIVHVEGVSHNSGPYTSVDLSHLELIYGEDGSMEKVWVCRKSWGETVTHWMPLPLPPRDDHV